LYVCLSACVSVSLCVFCQVLSLRARAMGAWQYIMNGARSLVCSAAVT
jgi:hypothetical protein